MGPHLAWGGALKQIWILAFLDFNLNIFELILGPGFPVGSSGRRILSQQSIGLPLKQIFRATQLRASQRLQTNRRVLNNFAETPKLIGIEHQMVVALALGSLWLLIVVLFVINLEGDLIKQSAATIGAAGRHITVTCHHHHKKQSNEDNFDLLLVVCRCALEDVHLH